MTMGFSFCEKCGIIKNGIKGVQNVRILIKKGEMADLSTKNRVFEGAKRLFMPCAKNGFKPRIFENDLFFLIIGFLAGLKILSVVSFGNYLGADIFNQLSQSDLYQLTNQERRQNGEQPLAVSSRLEAAAQLKLADMLQNNYFAHNSPQGATPWSWLQKANYNYAAAGENLAMNFYSSNEAMKAWMASESHRKNILLKDFSETGIAIGYGSFNGEKTAMAVQMFGRPFESGVGVKTAKTKTVSKTPSSQPESKSIITLVPQKKTGSPKLSPITLTKAQPEVKSAESILGDRQPLSISYESTSLFNKLAGLAVGLFAGLVLIKMLSAASLKFSVFMLKPVALIAIGIMLVFLNDGAFNIHSIIIQ